MASLQEKRREIPQIILFISVLSVPITGDFTGITGNLVGSDLIGDGEDEHSTSSIADLVDGVLAEIYQVGTVRTDIDPLFQLQQKILKMINIFCIHVDSEPDVFFLKVVLNATTIPRGVKRTSQKTIGGWLCDHDMFCVFSD
ncbi:hypothetical protein C2S51_029583 [Perilla frutescens var. frutescens]|nr:hypothetical protein C2S51_029583 [Perilla frutescens var. frutescens]